MTQALAGHAWWLASRASGLVALGLVTVSVVLGLMMAGKLSKRPGIGRTLSAIHEQTAVTGLVAIAVHGLTLLGDPWLNPGPQGIAIPFAMGYRPLFTGLGIIAGWLATVLGLSFYLRRRIGPRLWRQAHKATIVVFVLGVAHTIGAGTDASSPWLYWPVSFASALVAVLFSARVVEGIRKGRRRKAAARERRPAIDGTGRELPGREELPDVEIPPRHRRRELERPARRRRPAVAAMAEEA
jgi:methionine sulfoxide reductase heme-binding subunit